jgi:hypothetical protein
LAITHDTRRKRVFRRGLITLGAPLAALLASVVTVLTLFFSASEAARHAEGDGEFPRSILGILLFTGFREGDRFGVHASEGLLVFPVFVLVVAVVAAIPLLRSFATGR